MTDGLSRGVDSRAIRVAAALALAVLAFNLVTLVIGDRKGWTDFALPMLILGNLLALSHPRLRASRWTTRVYYPVAIAIALAIMASSISHIWHRS